MSIASMSVNSIRVVMDDGEGNSTPVVIDLDSRRKAGNEMALRFIGIQRVVQVSFHIMDGKLQMVTRNYYSDDDKPEVVTLHNFAHISHAAQAPQEAAQ